MQKLEEEGRHWDDMEAEERLTKKWKPKEEAIEGLRG